MTFVVYSDTIRSTPGNYLTSIWRLCPILEKQRWNLPENFISKKYKDPTSFSVNIGSYLMWDCFRTERTEDHCLLRTSGTRPRAERSTRWQNSAATVHYCSSCNSCISCLAVFVVRVLFFHRLPNFSSTENLCNHARQKDFNHQKKCRQIF